MQIHYAQAGGITGHTYVLDTFLDGADEQNVTHHVLDVHYSTPYDPETML